VLIALFFGRDPRADDAASRHVGVPGH